MRYAYPAKFIEEKEGGYSVIFPDLEGCYTCGDDLQSALYMAEDVLAFTLYHYEREGKAIPTPSKASAFDLAGNEFVNFVACDTLEYQKKNNNKAIKKTLSIPEWMNEAATAAGLNFSQVLQEAIAAKLSL